MTTPGFEQSPNPSYTASVQAASPPSLTADSKRTLFGRKKKSSLNLGASPSSSGILTSELNDSVESFGSAGSAKKKGVKDIFKRKGREDSVGGSEEGLEERGRNRDDEAGDDSDPESTPKLRPQSAGHLNTKDPQLSKKKSSSGLFSRRNVSPLPPGVRTRTSTMPSFALNDDEIPEGQRPSTAGAGWSQAPESNDPSTAPATNSAQPTSRKTSASLSKVNTSDILSDSAPQITATPPTPIENVTLPPPKNQFPSIASGTPQRTRASSTSKNPSKLSQSMTSPDTPPIAAEKATEETKQGGGFFQSMFSAAQNAATTLTNNMPLNLQNQQDRSRIVNPEPDDKTNATPPRERAEPGPAESKPEREPAVKTLGSGELSLAALGISNESGASTRNRSSTATSSASEVQHRGQRAINGSSSDLSQHGIDRSQTMPLSAMSQHNGFETASESSLIPGGMIEETPLSSRRGGLGGDRTPDRNSIIGNDENEAPDNSKRTGSVWSGQGSDKQRRHRGSSTASTSNTTQLIPRATGFAVATKKRNRDFHNLFRSVPEDDYLIEDYGCALQKEILLQGRFYVSEGHICFYSNILGWVTQLVISFDEVVSVEKKSTALLFPNGLVIQTLHARHTFASFITRDATYDLIIGLWNVGHPGLVKTPGEAHLDGAQEHANSSGEEEDDEYEDESDEDFGESFTDAGEGGYEDSRDIAAGSTNPSRKESELALTSGAEKEADGSKIDFPGPATHPPTSCSDEHYDKALCDEIFQVPLGRIYSLLFGSQSYRFVSSLLTDEEKVIDLQIPNEGQWTDQGGKKTRQYGYIRPLNGSIGPKQTKCNITETIDFCELNDHVTVTVSTQTPDVPSGGVFLVKTRYCLTWAEDNFTRLVLNCTVEWSGKSWIKGPIEKGATDGQIGFTKSLIASLKRELAPKKAIARVAGGKGKNKRKKDNTEQTAAPTTSAIASTSSSSSQPTSWGLFDPLKPVFEPVVDIIRPIVPDNLTTILLLMIIAWLLVFRNTAVPERNMHSMGPANWESRWRHEELSLWDWLEDRTGLSDHTEDSKRTRSRVYQQSLGARTAAKGLKDYQLKEAVQVMEERLEALKRIVEEKSMPSEKSGSPAQKKSATA